MGTSRPGIGLIVIVCLLLPTLNRPASAAPKNKPGAAKKQKGGGAKGIPKKSFGELDKDKNGFLSMTEIFGSKPKRNSPRRKAFNRADKDHNDWLNRKEFAVLKRNGLKGGGKKAAVKKGGKRKGGKKRKRKRKPR